MYFKPQNPLVCQWSKPAYSNGLLIDMFNYIFEDVHTRPIISFAEKFHSFLSEIVLKQSYYMLTVVIFTSICSIVYRCDPKFPIVTHCHFRVVDTKIVLESEGPLSLAAVDLREKLSKCMRVDILVPVPAALYAIFCRSSYYDMEPFQLDLL